LIGQAGAIGIYSKREEIGNEEIEARRRLPVREAQGWRVYCIRTYQKVARRPLFDF